MRACPPSSAHSPACLDSYWRLENNHHGKWRCTSATMVFNWARICAAAALVLATAGASQKPHIIFILGDDVGWANTQLHCGVNISRSDFSSSTNCSDVLTPNLLTLQQQGVHLLRHYGYKYCSPSRSSYMSGRYPLHVNEINPTYEQGGGVTRNYTMLPAKLKSQGYATHHVGKWHLGMSSLQRVPTGRGFDSSIGYLLGAEDHYTQRVVQGSHIGVDLWNNSSPAYGKNGTYGDLLYRQAALDIIVKHDPNLPLYLNLALQVDHDPQQAPQSYINRYPNIYSARATFNAMSSVIDDTVGDVVQALKSTGLWDNAIVVFVADNGGASGVNSKNGNNFPLRGGKHTDFEGGVRSTAVVSGGLIPSEARGTTRDQYMHICDWYATLTTLAGASPEDHVPGLPDVDGLNQWSMLTNYSSPSLRNEVPLSSGLSGEHVGDAGLIVGRYKLVVGDQEKGIGFWTGPLYPNGTANQPGPAYMCKQGCVFDLVEDPTEHHDLSSDLPNIKNQLQQRLAELVRTAYQTGKDGPARCQNPVDVMQANHGFWGPFCVE
eukprot:m.82283 g.82283  ORF g.82283 m.82283 type:complete len:548 (+) comp14613_c0_seq1:100-1743(+)